MPEQEYYNTIEQSSVAEFKDRGSRFLALAYPLNSIVEFKQILNDVKKEHAKATHHCFAYRLGMDGLNFRVSDNGEPGGSAGKPILGQIDSREFTNVLVIVVRYFGGSLLGIPGLINAYKTAAALALQVTPLVQKPLLNFYRLQFDYTQMNDVMRIVKQFDLQVRKQETQLFCEMEIGISRNRIEEVLFRFKDIRGAEVDKILEPS